MFCVRGVNLVASRTSTDKPSPFEQFIGRKIDAKVDLRIAFKITSRQSTPEDNQV
jgi:hypothetical protein